MDVPHPLHSPAGNPPAAPLADHLPWLDGLRGLAACWVFLAHVQILSGAGPVPVLSWGGLAVDLFMMLSGFLMAHHYLLRRTREPWEQPATWGAFWLRRFFRIAPLYYLLLAAALALGPWLGAQRDSIAAVWPHTATASARYTDQSLANLLAHLSFAFGAWPSHAFRTALPDWSIGLEMQFYGVFPMLMLLVARWGLLRTAAVSLALCLALRLLAPGFMAGFEMPAFLPLKLHVFLVGMAIALGRGRGLRRSALAALLLLTGIGLFERSTEAMARVLLAAALFYLMDDGSLPGPAMLQHAVALARRTLSTAPARWLGDTAYGLYLVHLLVLLPVAGWLAQQPGYAGWPAAARMAGCVVVAAPLTALIAWGLHRAVERPGIRWGKALVARLHARRSANAGMDRGSRDNRPAAPHPVDGTP